MSNDECLIVLSEFIAAFVIAVVVTTYVFCSDGNGRVRYAAIDEWRC
jgi:hypothetical protein